MKSVMAQTALLSFYLCLGCAPALYRVEDVLIPIKDKPHHKVQYKKGKDITCPKRKDCLLAAQNLCKSPYHIISQKHHKREEIAFSNAIPDFVKPQGNIDRLERELNRPKSPTLGGLKEDIIIIHEYKMRIICKN